MRRLILISLFVCSISPQVFSQDEQPEVYEPPRDYGTDWRASALLDFTTEDGLLIGGGPILYKFGFRKLPYVFRMQLVGGIALSTGAFKFEYTAVYPAISRTLQFDILARASQVEVRNFYGFGNESYRDRVREDDKYYRVNSSEYILKPTLQVKAVDGLVFGASIILKHFDVRQRHDRYLGAESTLVSGGDKTFLGGEISTGFDSRDRAVATTSGFFVQLAGSTFPDAFHGKAPFHRLNGDLRVYVTIPVLSSVTLALRAGGMKVFGQTPFYESALIGGPGSVRGFNAGRFAGDVAALSNIDLRLPLFRMKFFVPTDVGVFGLCDAGRVWVNGVSPGGWHVGVGGGISMAPIDPSTTVTLSLANSKDGLFVTGGLGFGF